MFETGPAAQKIPRLPPLTDELKKRVISALLLAPLGFSVAFFGGWFAVVITTFVAMLILSEWNDVTSDGRARGWFAFEIAVAAFTAIALIARWEWVALLGLVAVACLTIFLALRGSNAAWATGGLIYALSLPLSIVILLNSARWGFEAAVFICFVIWTTDVFAYFAGKGIGGPKLWPAISPKKTWAGFIAGLTGGVIAGGVMSLILGLVWSLPLALLAFALSLAGHGGDLYESWVKRHFDKKDSGQLIPGHGGIMDRMDGLLAAFVVAMVVGVARGGLHDCAGGLLSW
ncbi:MAG: phosphatidate cytidylyltransferase [Hyphomicrobiales bacterium]|nr:phosphatidate cytidylyltransferase [Hyphomicrobiales bacterium]